MINEKGESYFTMQFVSNPDTSFRFGVRKLAYGKRKLITHVAGTKATEVADFIVEPLNLRDRA